MADQADNGTSEGEQLLPLAQGSAAVRLSLHHPKFARAAAAVVVVQLGGDAGDQIDLAQAATLARDALRDFLAKEAPDVLAARVSGEQAEVAQSPLERAANAIEHEFVEFSDPETDAVSPYAIAKRVARAVLEAIREPSEGMTSAAANVLIEESDGCGAVAPNAEEAMAVWQAMIDAALEEG